MHVYECCLLCNSRRDHEHEEELGLGHDEDDNDNGNDDDEDDDDDDEDDDVVILPSEELHNTNMRTRQYDNDGAMGTSRAFDDDDYIHVYV